LYIIYRRYNIIFSSELWKKTKYKFDELIFALKKSDFVTNIDKYIALTEDSNTISEFRSKIIIKDKEKIILGREFKFRRNESIVNDENFIMVIN